MKENNENFGAGERKAPDTPEANRSHGAQGIDKAPGEETPGDLENFKSETQKGKKVDADPTQETDRPAKQDL